MTSISVELQTAIFEALAADVDLSAITEGRIYDGVPSDPTFPFITFGPSDGDAEDLVGVAARRETVQLDIWSRDGGRLRPCKEICDLVKNALHLADISLETHALISIRTDGIRVFRDPDGLTAHGVVVIEAELEEV